MLNTSKLVPKVKLPFQLSKKDWERRICLNSYLFIFGAFIYFSFLSFFLGCVRLQVEVKLVTLKLIIFSFSHYLAKQTTRRIWQLIKQTNTKTEKSWRHIVYFLFKISFLHNLSTRKRLVTRIWENPLLFPSRLLSH